MKVRKCPVRKYCFDYKESNCEGCDFGNEYTKLHKRIDRLKKLNETLTIQRNAWALTAKALEKEWISVEERLPEDEKNVLCYYGFDRGDGDLGMMFIGVLCYFCFDSHWQHESTELTVTHWMTLPEPPKGGANNA